MKNKLTIEQKKLIAEKVMGWVAGVDFFTLEDFNPDQDTPEGLSQFVDMIGALDDKKEILDERLKHKFIAYYEMRGDGIASFEWLCKHKYEVCMAVKEVIG